MTRVVKNALILLIFFFFHQLLVLIQLKILTNFLSKELLGEYLTLLAIAGTLAIFVQLGLPIVVSRFIAKYEALFWNITARRLILFSWLVILVGGAVLLVLTSLFSEKILGLVYVIPPSSHFLIWAMALNIVISFKAITYSSFYGLQRMEFPAVTEALIALAVSLLLFLCRFQLSVLGVLQINLLVNLGFSIFLSLFLVFWLNRKPRGVQGHMDFFADIKSFWLGAVVTSFLSIALNYTDQILISTLLSYSSVTIFYLAFKVIYLCRHMIAIPLDAFSPEMTRKWELNLKETLQEELRLFAKMMFILSVFLAALTFSLAQPIIYVISSQGFEESITLLMVLSLALPVITIFSPINYFFRAIGKIGYSLLADFVWLFGYLSCGFLFLKWKGLFGLAIAFLLVSLFLAIFNLQRVKKLIPWKIENLFGIAICGLSTTLITSVLLKVLPIPDIPKLLLGISIAFIGYNFLLVRGGIISSQDRLWLENLTSSEALRKVIAFGLVWPTGKQRI